MEPCWRVRRRQSPRPWGTSNLVWVVIRSSAELPDDPKSHEIPANPATRPERFELPTFGSVDRRSIQLSYGRFCGFWLETRTFCPGRRRMRVPVPGARYQAIPADMCHQIGPMAQTPLRRARSKHNAARLPVVLDQFGDHGGCVCGAVGLNRDGSRRRGRPISSAIAKPSCPATKSGRCTGSTPRRCPSRS